MSRFSRIAAATLAIGSSLWTSTAQLVGEYTDPTTGISFTTWSYLESAGSAAFTYGLVLPEDALTVDATEYIGMLRCAKTEEAGGWCGISHGQNGQMTQALLLMAWPHEDQVLTSFRFATGYTVPDLYTGDAKLTQISSNVTETSFEVLFRCENCYAWNQEGATGSVSTSEGYLVSGRASARESPGNPDCPDQILIQQHDAGFGQYAAQLADAPNPSYSSWVSYATVTPTGTCGGAEPTPTTTTSSSMVPTPTAACPTAVSGDQTYDYVVVGAGAGGIAAADRLSESGASVLLLEKGPPSTGRWGGTMKPAWLNETDLTRFDVPGLCNQIWVDSAGVACTDTDQMAGCVLGGGTAVNAGLWWKAYPKDWDENFPEGWHNSDVQKATDRVFSRIPGTTRPSQDGELYMHQGVDVLSAALKHGGWQSVGEPNSNPTKKNHTFGSTTYMYSEGERGGPLATYLVSASERENFKLVTNLNARRAIRDGARVTGVELDCVNADGNHGVVSLTPDTGRVIVSAGTFGSAKFLFRSGIGPTDQLEVVAASVSDGANMVPAESWIDLPVGENLVDHVNTDTYIVHPDVVFYDFYEAWKKPIESDKEAYLNERTGVLTQAAPNIGPVVWTSRSPLCLCLTLTDHSSGTRLWAPMVSHASYSGPPVSRAARLREATAR
jgi:cellobiose dehydrogenase (acceptor)